MLFLFILPYGVGITNAENEVESKVSMDNQHNASEKNTNDRSTNDLYLGNIVISSSTIVGFIGLGSIFGLRLKENKIIEQAVCLLFATAFIILTIAIHLHMITSIINHTFTKDQFIFTMNTTIVSIAIIVSCFAAIPIFQGIVANNQHPIQNIVKQETETYLQKDSDDE